MLNSQLAVIKFYFWIIASFDSGSGGGSIVEPLSAVPLNDELQQARAVMAKAEADVLFRLTEKVAYVILWKLFSN